MRCVRLGGGSARPRGRKRDGKVFFLGDSTLPAETTPDHYEAESTEHEFLDVGLYATGWRIGFTNWEVPGVHKLQDSELFDRLAVSRFLAQVKTQ